MFCWIDHVWSSKECGVVSVIPVCISVPSIGFVFVCYPSFKSLRAGSHVFALLMLFL